MSKRTTVSISVDPTDMECDGDIRDEDAMNTSPCQPTAAIRPAGDGYDVDSTSGKTYHVHSTAHIERGSGSMFFRWHCTCPARRRCRHIDAVVQARWQEAAADGDYDGMNVMDREEF